MEKLRSAAVDRMTSANDMRHFRFILFQFFFNALPIFFLCCVLDSNPATCIYADFCGHGVKQKKIWCTTHFVFVTSKIGKKRERPSSKPAHIYGTTYTRSTSFYELWHEVVLLFSFFLSFGPPERDGQREVFFRGGTCGEEIWRWQPCVDITGW